MKKTESAFSSLPGMLVFALFALCLLLVLLVGVRVWQQTLLLTEQTGDVRIKTQYLATRLRQGQSVRVEDFGGCEALAVRRDVDGECYVTYVYCHEGWLRELTCTEGASMTPADGEKVLAAESLTLSCEDTLLTAQIDGQKLYLQLRTGKAVGP